MRKEWIVKDQELVHENPYFSVFCEQVVRPDGISQKRHTILTSESVLIVATMRDGRFPLVEIDRYPGQGGLELPGGGVEQGRSPIEAAQDELLEETGYRARTWRALPAVSAWPAFSRMRSHVYMAEDLEQVAAPKHEEEGIVTQRFVTFAESIGLIKEGRIVHAGSIAGIMHAALMLGAIKT